MLVPACEDLMPAFAIRPAINMVSCAPSSLSSFVWSAYMAPTFDAAYFNVSPSMGISVFAFVTSAAIKSA